MSSAANIDASDLQMTWRPPISRRSEASLDKALDRLCGVAIELVKAQEAEIDHLEVALKAAKQRKQWLIERYVQPVASML